MPGALGLAESFRKMPENTRIDTIRCILLAITYPPDVSNELIETSPANTIDRKKRRRTTDSIPKCSTRYVVRRQMQQEVNFLIFPSRNSPHL